MKKGSLLCGDWGTSNFRLSLVDIATERVLGMVKSNQGIARTFAAWQENTTINRVDFFRTFLKKQIQRLAKTVTQNLDELPVILSGMASSSIGMMEVPYARIPFSINQPILSIKHFPEDTFFTNELYLYGGLRSHNDVMRGEEVQLLGLEYLITAPIGVCLLPGTHSKHIWIENKTITDFHTFMTGECFQILGANSILNGSIKLDKTFDEPHQLSFKQGVLKAQSGNFLNNLFTTRTNTLLKGIQETANYYYLSGLLIGQELRSLQNFQGQLLLMGDSPLVNYYQLALSVLQLDKHLSLVSSSDMDQCIPKAHLKLYQSI